MSYLVINDLGKEAVEKFVRANEKRSNDLNAWYSDAEMAANNAAPGGSIIIEMRSFSTASGRPETATLSAEFFDTVECAEC